jgi:protein-S-isoprenylcysteine O-methyltransferase
VLRLAGIAFAVFPLSEIVLGLVRRSRAGAASRRDRGSLALLWLVICAGVGAGVLARAVTAARMQSPLSARLGVALGLLIAGLAIRWTAILTLGRFFTVDVAVQQEHAVVDWGLYRLVRHPSYTGLLLAFAGLGVYFGNWLSLAAILIPISLAVGYRVRVEEEALRQALGAAYTEYGARTWRFVPWLY